MIEGYEAVGNILMWIGCMGLWGCWLVWVSSYLKRKRERGD